MAEPFGTLSPGSAPSLRDKLADLLAMAYGGGKGGQAMGRQASGLFDWLPGTGEALSAEEGVGAWNEGDYLGAALGAAGAIPVAGKAVKPVKKAVKAGREALAEAAPSIGIKAYHGSPHSFDEFDISKIGTGEGAQAYGHGLYFAENEGTAKAYRDQLSGDNLDYRNWWSGDENTNMGSVRANAEAAIRDNNFHPDHARRVIRDIEEAIQEGVPAEKYLDEFDVAPRYREAYEAAIPHFSGVSYRHNPGHMYEVNINADPDAFLDWDKPLSEQGETVRKAIGLDRLPQKPSPDEANALFKLAKERGVPAHSLPEYKALEARMDSATGDAWDVLGVPPPNVNMRPEELPGSLYYQGLATGDAGVQRLSSGAPGGPDVSRLLQERGIPGIKYLDAGSRNPIASSVLLDGQKIPSNDYVAQAAADALGTHGTPEAAIEALGAHPGYKNTNKDAAELLRSGRITTPPQSRNYVVFDDKLVEIVKKYGIMAALGAGLISQEMAQQMQAQGLGGDRAGS